VSGWSRTAADVCWESTCGQKCIAFLTLIAIPDFLVQ